MQWCGAKEVLDGFRWSRPYLYPLFSKGKKEGETMKNDLIEASIKILRERLQGHPLEAMLLVLVLGLRRDEVRRLTWSEVDLHTGEMAVCSSKTKSQVRRLRLPEN